MKKNLLILLNILTLCASALAHSGIEIGPNGGRIIEFSKNETMHGELTLKGDRFEIALLDKEMKPVAVSDQELTITIGDRSKPEKIAVEKKDTHFTFPTVKAGEWIVFQFKQDAKAKAITARVQYDVASCGACKKPEWLCACAADKKK